MVKDTGFYEPYASFARTLRAWFIAFGIGVPALLMSQEHLFNKVLASGSASRIAILFLAGAFLQVGQALLYKYVMWSLYMVELDAEKATGLWHKVADKVSVATELELLIDVATIVSFAAAIWTVLQVIGR